MVSAGAIEESDRVEQRIARRLADLRADRGWSLEVLADRSGISRATLSRLERSELSPTAAMLGKLCTVYGWTLSRLMAEAETQPVSLVKGNEQSEWTDPESGYCRRMISPPGAQFRGEMVEVTVPAGSTVSFSDSPVAGLEHHLWMLSGELQVDVEGRSFTLAKGDSLRYLLTGPSRFRASGSADARYVVLVVRP